MKSFSHANNIILRRVIYIHSLPGLKLVKRFSLANETWCAVTVAPFDFVKGDCVVGNAVLGKKGYKRSTEYTIYSRKSTNLTVVGLSCKTKGKNLSWQKAQQWVFSTVYVMLQAVYTTAEKEFRSIAVFGLRWHIKAPIRHKRWNSMLFHPVLYKGNGLQSRVLFYTFRIVIKFQIIHITRCESLRIEQDFIKCSCQPKKLSIFAISYRANALA